MNHKEQGINYDIMTSCTPLRIYPQTRITLLEMWNLQTSLAILGTLCLTAVSGYKNGKVEKSCESMMPEHHSQPNTTASPYKLTVNTSKFSPGMDIRGEGGETLNNDYDVLSKVEQSCWFLLPVAFIY